MGVMVWGRCPGMNYEQYHPKYKGLYKVSTKATGSKNLSFSLSNVFLHF